VTNALARFVAEVGPRQAGADAPWWFDDVLLCSMADRPTALTGGRIGILLAVSSDAPEDIRATAQPQVPNDVLRQMLLRCDPNADSSVELLAQNSGSAGYLGIGASLTHIAAPARVYYGCAERPGSLAARLARLGMWPNRLSADAEHLLSLLTSGATVIGAARGLCVATGHTIYFDAGNASPSALLDHVATRLGSTVSAAAIASVEASIGSADLAGQWGLAVSLDAAGEIRDLKAEFSLARGSAPETLLPAVRRTEAHARVARAAAAAGLELQCQTVSYSGWRGSQRSSGYFALLTPDDQWANRASMHISRTEPVKTRGRLRRACLLTLDSLHAAQSAAGSWQDFDLPSVGASDHWVTAHIATRLHEIGATFDSRDQIARAADFLAREWTDGLGYNSRSPPDADSTAHGLLLFAVLRPELVGHNIRHLLRFQRHDGSFGTFRHEHETSSWTLGHPEVTAVAIQALARCIDRAEAGASLDRAFAWAAAQGWTAMRTSFWWNLRWASRVQWIVASHAMGREPGPELLDVPLERLVTSSLDTGYYLHWALLTGQVRDARLAANALLETQQANGLWPTKPVLKVMPDQVPMAGGGIDPAMIFADNGYYSGALILSALYSWGRAVGEFS